MEDSASKPFGAFESKQPFPPLLDDLTSPTQESYVEDEVISPGYDEIEVEGRCRLPVPLLTKSSIAL
jgi:hypothetical protein